MTEWTDICALDAVPVRGARCLKTPHGKFALFRTIDDHVYVIEDQCPHKNGPLSQGIVHGAFVTCPLHNWVISLETGEAQGADEGRVRTLETRLTDGRVEVVLPAAAQAAE